MDTHFRIDDLQVYPDRLIVMRDGKEIRLEPRMMQVLVTLAEHAGETMSTERLLIDIWRGSFYGDNPVNATISKLRKNIGDDSRKPKYIETISKVGYRLISSVTLPEDYRRFPTGSERWTKGCPYVGLSAFDDSHASVFCGRDATVDGLLKAMRGQIDDRRRFLLVVGSSGCGKTSILRAGAIPLLTKANGFDGLKSLSMATCDLASVQAGDIPSALMAAIATWKLEGRPVMPPQTPEQLWTLFTETPDAIQRYAQEAFRRHTDCIIDQQAHAHLLLIIDHAEVLVANNDIAPGSLDAFANVLQAICACPHTFTIMVVRLDFYPRLSEALPLLADLKGSSGHLEVFTPRYGEIGEIIRKPAWQADLSFEKHPENHLRLDDVLRDATRYQSDALPLLQHTLQMLYERRTEKRFLTFAAYDAIGGLEGAVAHRAEQVFSALPSEAKKSLDIVLTKLVNVKSDDDLVSARRADTKNFPADARVLVEAFIEARLFVSGLHQGDPTVGVVHEAVLRQWPRALEWVQENRRLLQAMARLRLASKRWIDSGKRDDHLLNTGRPLGEAREVAARFPTDLTDEDHAFLQASERIAKRRSAIRNATMAAMSVMLLASCILTLQSNRLKHKAQERRAETLRLSEFMLNDLARNLKKQGDFDLMDRISNKAMELLDQRPIDDLSAEELVLRSHTYVTLGESLNREGKIAEAGRAFRSADIAASAAVLRAPDDLNVLNESGQTAFWLGDHYRKQGQFADAKKAWERYRNISDQLVQAAPSNPKWLIELSYAFNNLGTLAADEGHNAEALHFFSKSLSLKQFALELDPENLDYRKESTDTRSWITNIQEETGALSDARRSHADQIISFRQVIRKYPKAKAWKRWLANALVRSAQLASDSGKFDQAYAEIDEAIRIFEQILPEKGGDSSWRRDLAYALMARADIKTARNGLRRGSNYYEEALTTIDTMDVNDFSPYEWNRLKSLIHLKYAATGEQTSHARAKIEKALAALDALYQKHPSDRASATVSAEALIAAGRYLNSAGDQQAALSTWWLAIKTISPDGKPPDGFRAKAYWVNAHCLVGLSSEVRTEMRWLTSIGYSRIAPECRNPAEFPTADPHLASH